MAITKLFAKGSNILKSLDCNYINSESTFKNFGNRVDKTALINKIEKINFIYYAKITFQENYETKEDELYIL